MPVTDFSDWKGCPFPEREVLEGQYCRLELFDVEKHATSLYEAAIGPGMEERYQYLPGSPPKDFEDFKRWMQECLAYEDRRYFSVIDKRTGRAEGRFALIFIEPHNGAAEFGDVQWGRAIQRSRVATEAFYLISEYLFSLGYRRYVWRCNSLNEPSRRAAERFGFQYEGKFRNHMVLKGASRDTLWFSTLDTEWPKVSAGFRRWLDPANFDESEQQRSRLEF